MKKNPKVWTYKEGWVRQSGGIYDAGKIIGDEE